MRLKKKTAVITGGTGVIGSAIVRAYLAEGARVIVASSRDASFMKDHVVRAGDYMFVKADVAKEDDVCHVMEEAKRLFGGLDILVCAAGTHGALGRLEDIAPRDWMKAIEVNLLGTMQSIKYALPLLHVVPRAKIITFAGGGEGPRPYMSAYVASKAGILRLTETLAQELGGSIDINAISPGLVNSGLAKRILELGASVVGDALYESTRRELSGEADTVSPDHAAMLAVFLASSESDGLSGRNISAIWDQWEHIPKHRIQIMDSDIYTQRRIKPRDRGYGWK